MKKLLITLLLVSPFSFADWGDVYYCQETNSLEITLEGKLKSYKSNNIGMLGKFQFKLDKTKNAMLFGKGGFFGGQERELREEMNWPSKERWFADSQWSMVYFDEGKFLYVGAGASGSVSISADCDKF